MTPWPHQTRGHGLILDAIAGGHMRNCYALPTAGGKDRIMAMLIESWTEARLKTALYTNRKLLIEQTSRVMNEHGIDHGIRAAGFDADDAFHPVQICSLQTENRRVFKDGRWRLHDADRVLIDEAHLQTGDVMQKVMAHHLADGAAIVGMTATPLGLDGLYDKLIVGSNMSELRKCGALVPCVHFGPDEPDLREIKVPLGEDLTERQAVKVMMRDGIIGRVLKWFERLNPKHKPTILFAPGVRESIWFAEQFESVGVRAAHIDGENVWLAGKLVRSSREARAEVLAKSKSGEIVVVCNRFVLREGIDAPWLEHGIFATVFGSLQTFIQSGGRLLRASPSTGKTQAVIQDQGGNWWRHGSLNADREWSLEYTSATVAGMREDRLRGKRDKEPVRCRQCGLILNSWRCRLCGFEVQNNKKSRPVVQSDGTLKEMTGDIFRPRRICQKPNAEQIWERMYWRARNSGMTFRQAIALFAQENNWGWPSRSWRLMPVEEIDFFRCVADVPVERLRSYLNQPGPWVEWWRRR
jgi:DNA repair protein RadD